MTDKKYRYIISITLLFSFLILIALSQATKLSIDLQKQIIVVILLLSAILAIIFFVFNFVASFIKKLTIWSSTFNAALIMYFGILVFSLAQYKELLSETFEWDVSMAALGIAILVFGWSFVTQHLQEQTTKRNQEKIETTLSTINENIESLKRSTETCLEKIK
jgi:glucan phosphoethanolaminetransferase (alkaline phosphatase superfamily)